MSVLSRVHQAEVQTEQEDGDLTSLDRFSTLTLDNPTLRRLKIVLEQLTNYAQADSASKYSRYAWLLQAMMEEVFTELDEGSPENLGLWFEQFGAVIQWTGNGDERVLPDIIREWMLANHPEEMTLAIEAAST